MKSFFVVAVPIALSVVTLAGQGPPPQPLPPGVTPLQRAAGETPVTGKCLFKEDLDLIAARRALTRTTLNNDAPIPFDPEYFVGRWKFEYETPESALGPGGPVTGTETIQHVAGCLYEGTAQAKGPSGAFTVKSMLVYDPSAHYLVVLERDSRGFEVLKSGRVGGDSGGFFTHHWQAAPLTVKGKKVRLKGTTFVSSPGNYRVRTEIAEDDDPFVNLGAVWIQRQGTTAAK